MRSEEIILGRAKSRVAQPLITSIDLLFLLRRIYPQDQSDTSYGTAVLLVLSNDKALCSFQAFAIAQWDFSDRGGF